MRVGEGEEEEEAKGGTVGTGSVATALSSMAYVELAIATPPPSSSSSSTPTSIGTTYRVVRSSPLSISSIVGDEAFELSSTTFVVRRSEDGEGGHQVTMIAIASSGRRLILATMDVASSSSTSTTDPSTSTCVVRRGRFVEIDAVHPYMRRIMSIDVDVGRKNDGGDIISDGPGGIRGAYHVVRVSGVDDR